MPISLRAACCFALLPPAIAVAIWCGMTQGAEPAGDDFAVSLAAWRDARLASLTSESGWLSLVGLFWLTPGENRFGAGTGNAVVLPAGTAPDYAGAFFLEGGAVRVVAPESSGLTMNGKPVQSAAVADDGGASPDELRLGRLRMIVIRRGGRLGIRVKDPENPARVAFHGIESFPPDPAYRVNATFEPYPEPRPVDVPTVLGTTERMTAPGVLRFTLRGKALTLEPLLEGPDAKKLFLIFRDETSGRTTYGAGRFLYTEQPKDGIVVLDFNRAYNPPCAFTPYATCPLAPRKNRLPVAIEAGERAYGHPDPPALR